MTMHTKKKILRTAAAPHLGRAFLAAMLCVLMGGCSASPRSAEARKGPQDQVGRPTVTATEAQNIQSSVMALADTAMQRIASEINLARSGQSPEARRDEMATRLTLSSALVAIAMQPDPVDALADMLTFTTLTADAQRVAAMGKPADSYEARLQRALEQNDADSWNVAQRWVNEPTRIAFRERILSWSGARRSAADVAFVRLADLKRTGSTSVEADSGLFDSLHAATQQIDQTRLLAERSLFLAQRIPFLMRWQAEVYTGNALATKEAQQTQAQIEQMSAIMETMSRLLAGLAQQVSSERQAALDDLFGHIKTERSAALLQIQDIVNSERQATLRQATAAIDAQRKAILEDLLQVTDSATRTGSAWIWRTLLIGAALIVLLLLGLLATMLLYRRLLPLVAGESGLASTQLS
jgi:hypothetical protein